MFAKHGSSADGIIKNQAHVCVLYSDNSLLSFALESAITGFTIALVQQRRVIVLSVPRLSRGPNEKKTFIEVHSW